MARLLLSLLLLAVPLDADDAALAVEIEEARHLVAAGQKLEAVEKLESVIRRAETMPPKYEARDVILSIGPIDPRPVDAAEEALVASRIRDERIRHFRQRAGAARDRKWLHAELELQKAVLEEMGGDNEGQQRVVDDVKLRLVRTPPPDQEAEFEKDFLGRELAYWRIQNYGPSCGFYLHFLLEYGKDGDRLDWARYRRFFRLLKQDPRPAGETYEKIRHFGWCLAECFGPRVWADLERFGFPILGARDAEAIAAEHGELPDLLESVRLEARREDTDAALEALAKLLERFPTSHEAAFARRAVLESAQEEEKQDVVDRMTRELGILREWKTCGPFYSPAHTTRNVLWRKFLVTPGVEKDAPANQVWLKPQRYAGLKDFQVDLVLAMSQPSLPKFTVTIDGEGENDGLSGWTFIFLPGDGKISVRLEEYDRLVYHAPAIEVPPAKEMKVEIARLDGYVWVRMNDVVVFDRIHARPLKRDFIGFATFGPEPAIEQFTLTALSAAKKTK